MKSKKGQEISLKNVVTVVGIFLVAILFLTFGSSILGGVSADFAAEEDVIGGCTELDGSNCTSAGYNISQNGLSGFTNLSGQFGNVGTVIGAVLVIGVLIGGFMIGRQLDLF